FGFILTLSGAFLIYILAGLLLPCCSTVEPVTDISGHSRLYQVGIMDTANQQGVKKIKGDRIKMIADPLPFLNQLV
ncbi:MAG: hypothetical protein D3917_07415, partial [Candidatus Electrothrix sp. AX5]|nr:hypothetical protein [Candidatus Electrothrix sp. AX5]